MMRVLIALVGTISAVLAWATLSLPRTVPIPPPSTAIASTATVAAVPTIDVQATAASQARATRQAVPTRRPTPQPLGLGDVGWIYAELVSGGAAKDVPVAGSPIDFLAYRKSMQAKDDIGLRDLFLQGKLVDVPVGTQARVIDTYSSTIDLVEVRFLDGLWQSTSAWLDQSWVVYALPPSFVRLASPSR